MHNFDLNAFLHEDSHLLLVAPDTQLLSRIMHLAALTRGQIGFITDNFPFLSNLSILENITLGSMYTYNISQRKARNRIVRYIHALSVENLMDKRKEFLTREELIRSFFLRCLSSNNSIILMESPTIFQLEVVFNCIQLVDYRVKLWVTCHNVDRFAYENFDLKQIVIGNS